MAQWSLVKAIVYTKYGPPDVLQLTEVRKPVPQAGEILIRVRAAEVTKGDCEMRSFRFAVKWFWLPLRIAFGLRRPRRAILGGYFAGDVAELGRDVTRFKVGERVFGAAQLRLGAYGEYLALPASYTIVTMPDNMNYTDTAAVPLGGLNALHFMRRAKIRVRDKVLINGAGGSIGTHAVQIAKSLGAEVTVVDAARKEDALRRLGADHFIDYQTEDFTATGRTYDVIFDMVAGSPYSACIRSLKPGGRYLSGNPTLAVMFFSILTNLFSNKTASFAFARESHEELLALKELIEAGQIRSIVDRVYPMAQVAEAHRRVEAEQRVGAIVMTMP